MKMGIVSGQLTDEQERAPGVEHSTVPISDWPRQHASLVSVVAAVRSRFIADSEWRCTTQAGGGSFTLKHKRDRQQVIKILIDDNARLANDKYHLQMHGTPVVVGIELTHLPPDQRRRWRRLLRRAFGSGYMNPETGYPKTTLSPQRQHLYDIIFIAEGDCSIVSQPAILAHTEAALRKAVGKRDQSDSDK